MKDLLLVLLQQTEYYYYYLANANQHSVVLNGHISGYNRGPGAHLET